MADRVPITYPDGSVETVAPQDVAQAKAAGGHQSTPEEVHRAQTGVAGEIAAPVLGAARVATVGMSDDFVADVVDLVGGRGPAGKQDVLDAIRVNKDANPIGTGVGEFGGLLLPMGFGKAVAGAGAAVDAGVGGLIGEGLLARAVGMGARGAVESGMLGAEHQITEDHLLGQASTPEKIFAAAVKDALFGAGIGAGLGLLAHGAGQFSGLLRKSPGRVSDAALDEIAGTPGAGRTLHADARTQQEFVDELVRSGATREQAAVAVDDMLTHARARSSAGPLSGPIDAMAERTAAARAGGNPEMEEILLRGYRDGHKSVAAQDKILADGALGLKKTGDEALRLIEDTLDEAQFGNKSDKMAKLVDGSKFDAQRDTIIRLAQHVEDVVDEWSALPNRGGAEGAVSKLEKELDSFIAWNKRTSVPTEAASRDMFIRADKMKRAIDALARWGERPYGLPEALTMPDTGIRSLADKFRNALEDHEVWGAAGLAQKEWNASFSQALPRRIDFGKRFTNAIDVDRGMPIRALDAGKLQEGLVRLGDEAKSLEDVTSTHAFIDGLRGRITALEKFGALSESEAARIAKGKKALDSFEETYNQAGKDARMVARLRAQRLEEGGPHLGGILGLAADVVTRPLTTMERLATVRQTVARFERVLGDGIGAVFGTKPRAKLPDAAPLRSREVVTKEIGELRELAGNPAAVDERAKRMVGDLPEHAPKLSAQVADQARRALSYLISVAPSPRVTTGPFETKPKERYSDEDIHSYEASRAGAFEPKSLLHEMHHGKLNREGLAAVRAVSPNLFGEMQQIARKEIERLQAQGVLDKKIPYEKQAAIAALLEVPAGPTWEPDFLIAMQSTKAPPVPGPPQAGKGGGGGKRAPMKKVDTAIFETGAQKIEGSGHLL